jgi:hypothetical protein
MDDHSLLDTKFCPSYEEDLPRECFYARQASKDGLQAECIECQTTRLKDWYQRTGKATRQARAQERAKKKARHAHLTRISRLGVEARKRRWLGDGRPR